jgi:hypothetical protein
MALLGDFFVGLGQGALTYWLVALGPAFIILFVRVAWHLLTRRPVKSNPRIEPTVAKDRL